MAALHMILASNSPRRKELLALTGQPFTVQAGDVDETPQPGELPSVYVARLARAKAQVVARSAPADALIIAADTTVENQGQILGKPADALEAAGMLRALRGKVHQVHTGIAILEPDNSIQVDVCSTPVPMRAYSDEEIQRYVDSGDPMDKAGAYAIQNKDFHPVERLEGCFANVMGLPLCHLVRNSHPNLATPPLEVARRCQAFLEYACPVYSEILGVSQ